MHPNYINNTLLQTRNIYLIGMMGVGKSTVGSLLAQQLKYRFFDTDAWIEEKIGTTINQLFNSQGEQSFRGLETKALSKLSSQTRSVLATGGGSVVKKRNWRYLNQGLTVWLDVPLEILIQRLAGDSTRPLAAQLESLFNERRPSYALANLSISIEDSQTPQEIVSQIMKKLT